MAYHGSLLLCLLLARDLYDHMIECSGIEIQFQNSICKVQLPGIKYFILGQNFFFVLDMYPGVELLGHMVVLTFSFFWNPPYCFP